MKLLRKSFVIVGVAVIGAPALCVAQLAPPRAEFKAVEAAVDIEVVEEAPAPARATRLIKIAKPAAAATDTKPEEPKPATATGAAGAAGAAAAPGAPAADPETVRLDLMDGSGISGKLSVKEINVETKFGTLTIPITAIKSFTPGLDSYPQLEEQVTGLIAKLGSEDFNEREQAHKDLVKLGAQVRAELQRNLQDGNAERVRHIKGILTELEQQADADDDDGPKKGNWIRLDTVETMDFTVTGKITPKSFEMASKYGPLTIKLADVRRGYRMIGGKEEIRKSISVEGGTNLVQRAFKTSGIKVEKGDKVTVTAEGTIVMTPWGSDTVSTPDGGENFGWYIPNSIYGGALCAKIGSQGPVFKVGSKTTFTADRSGTLEFGIAMQAQYARNNYQFPGKYDVKIKVDGK